MGLFGGKEDCYKCGREVDKASAEKRFGKYFCSEAEAEEVTRQVEMQRAKMEKKQKGGCC